MYTLDRLLEDVLRQYGPFTKRGAGYVQVWDAFNRYITDCISKRQTLNVLNFCKIGWRVEGQTQGKTRLRPHFQMADAFTRAHGVDTKNQIPVNDKLLTHVEEFNFSKAAIRFSNCLTKDNIFMGLRAMLQHLGHVVATGQPVSLDFEVGKLFSNERDVRFSFNSDLYLQEGLAVPAGAQEAADYKPSVSFAPPTQDALKLRLDGSNADTIREKNATGTSYDGAESESTCDPGSSHSVSSESIKGRVQREAMRKHLTQLGIEASCAVADREQWEKHLKQCSAEETRDQDRRKAINKENALHLQMQMQEADKKRTEGRLECIEQASCHDFPNFAEAPENAYQYIREKKNNLKQDLDEQVEMKQLKNHLERRRNREMDATHVQASNRETALLKLEAAAKKESERQALAQAWEKDKSIRTVRKSIEEHHRKPPRQAHDMLRPLADVSFSAASSPRLSTAGPPSARPVTGSVRRMPLGAAASLALQKQKLKMSATARR
jgi:hypothetical protein